MQNTPMYMAIMQDIKKEIKSGVLKSGDQLKSEQDYARQYGVSTITIRKALELLVGEALIVRIKGKGSFVAKPPAQTDVSHLMAVVFSIEDFYDVSFMQIIMGLQRSLAQMNYSLIVEWNNRNIEDERTIIQNLIQKQVDGVFLYPYNPDASQPNYRLLEQAHIPFILLDHCSFQTPTNFVSCDNRMGGAMATSYMLSMHHRRLLFINYDFILSSERERYESFYNLMNKNGLCNPTESLMIGFNDIDFDQLTARIRAKEITGLVCANDKLAIRCINQLIKHGLNVPDDVSVIGFDDWERDSISPVPLTTIRQSFLSMGTCAAQLMRMVRECQLNQKCCMLTSVELVCRQSVRDLGGIE